MRWPTSCAAHVSSFTSIVMFALSRREMGQPAFAPFAISSTLDLSAPGTLAVTSRCDCVTVKPASVFSSVTVAVVWMDSGVIPALPSSAENAIEKQPAWAAAMSSSGFVPTPFSKRVLKEYCVSSSTPLSVEIAPVPSFKPPRQIADALRFMFGFVFGLSVNSLKAEKLTAACFNLKPCDSHTARASCLPGRR